jgi:endonuclease-3
VVTPRSLRGRAREVVARLAREYPGTAQDLCALDHDGPFQLLVATILSAQCTDERVNMVTPGLFAAYPTPEALAAAPREDLEARIFSTGFFRSKSKNLMGMAQALTERYEGEVPPTMGDLVTLPGVGRKTANVVRSVAMDLPGLPVDTHVGRLVRRLGLTTQQDPVKVESEIDALVPPQERGALILRLILHRRRVCPARSPRCEACVLADICPSAQLPIRPSSSVEAPSPRARPARPARPARSSTPISRFR